MAKPRGGKRRATLAGKPMKREPDLHQPQCHLALGLLRQVQAVIPRGVGGGKAARAVCHALVEFLAGLVVEEGDESLNLSIRKSYQ